MHHDTNLPDLRRKANIEVHLHAWPPSARDLEQCLLTLDGLTGRRTNNHCLQLAVFGASLFRAVEPEVEQD